MPGQQDANIKLLYPVDNGTFFTADTVANGAEFAVVANVEIGQELMEVITKEDLFVSVVNLSRSTVVQRKTVSNSLAPQADPLNQELRVTIDPTWSADEGDVLQAIATYKVTSGLRVDLSTALSPMFVVSA
ncbi:hypothetical protein [Phytohabitans aurantiacus]|jgi:hypothetical protein|uniref:Flp pilus assembly protein RcpC/CpaB domain-containing protein n=1 Tax=Phytohabitans aurantiacus TaxID=3016789 RepID=A0ABQ5R6K4_9ACTN|nr:hypothetical protein [Phytohabitans aurantiacus]GLI02201.1 hypothetical protein Pa4123_74790 [Phytohabitans aurantiacus]